MPTAPVDTPNSSGSCPRSVPVVAPVLPRRVAAAPRIASGGLATSNSAPSMTPVQRGSRGRALSKRDLLMMVTRLAIMLRSGVDLAEAVRSIATHSTSEPIRAAMGDVFAALEAGSSLSQAMDAQRDKFGGVTVASIAAGEAAGKLPEVLARLSVILRDELRLRSALGSAVSYPLVLLVVTLLVLAAMIFFVLPQFAGIYAASRAPTPALTALLLAAADWARSYWWLVSGVLAGCGWSLVRYLRSPRGRRFLDHHLIRWPVVGTTSRALITGRMFRLQGAMLDNGVPLLDVLLLTRQSVGNSCFADLIDAVRESIVHGDGVATALRAADCIPDGAADMVATAEANGQLGNVLQTIGEFYESEGEQHLRDAVKIAEPAIIVALGLVVGVIVLAVMLPLLDLSTAGSM